ncbi:MAG: S49 family peptidase [Methylomicrobium sp.]|nr:S49 family peptidase [Methylomicrobium sp.]
MESNNDMTQGSDGQKQQGWEREVIEKLALAAVTEQRKARHWSIFFKLLLFFYLVAVFVVAMYPSIKKDMDVTGGEGHTAVIDVVGVIAEDKPASFENISQGLRDAAKDKNTKGIILHINSPGGSPVQSDYIFHEIRQVKQEFPDLPIFSVVSDICASGGYYVASATDKIYVNEASLIGSIGVVINGFGFVDTLEKMGVERRTLTAGDHKAMLDPFLPVNELETRHMQTLLNQVHKQFIDAVKKGRGDRLKETSDMFSGLVWTGKEGVSLGLADDFGSDKFVAKNIIGAEKLVNFTPSERIMDRLFGKLGTSFGHAVSAAFTRWDMR